ncbi:hypothetical protein C4565_10520 [Candidatus Parcubacteria bacterium]|nr:MAG: hypothetical protein C4565_10520 [Candidatus Parcubacteria bacterium]
MLFTGLLFFIFLIVIRPQDFLPGIKGAPIVFITMSVLLAVWMMAHQNKKLIRMPQDKYVSLFFLSIVISTLTAKWITYSIDITIETIKIALIYYFIVTIVDSFDRLIKTTWVIVLLMSVVGFMGILQHYGYNITGVEMIFAADKGIWQIRGIGLFDNPNDLAYSVVLVIPFCLGLFLSTNNPIAKLFSIFLILSSCYCIFLTGSRGGLLALFGCLSLWLFFWIENIRIRKLMILFVCLAMIGAFVSLTQDYRNDKSSMGRVEAWVAGMEMFKAHPLIGVGKDQFREYHKKDSHNSYVRVGSELGFLGLYAFIGTLYFTFISLLKTPYEKIKLKTLNNYRAGYGGYLGAYSIASIFSTRTYDIIFLICVALIGTSSRLVLNEIEEEPAGFQTERCWYHSGIAHLYVFLLTMFSIFVWKLFLIQVW